MYLHIGKPASLNSVFMTALSMPQAEASTPQPTYGMSAISSSPWTVPSSPYVPWRTGKITSIGVLSSAFDALSPLKPGSPASETAELSNLSNSFSKISRVGAVRSWRDRSGLSHLPELSIAIGTTSYLLLSICSITVFAERTAISCSPERPPKITPTRSFIKLQSFESRLQAVLDAFRRRWFCKPSVVNHASPPKGGTPNYKIVFPNADKINSHASSTVMLL